MGGDERDIPEGWTLTPADLTLVMAKGRANRLGFAVLLLFFREHGRFPGGRLGDRSADGGRGGAADRIGSRSS